MSVSANKNIPGAVRSRGSTSRLVALALIAGSTMLAGCGSYDRDHFIVGSVPDDYRTRHPIVVTESEVTADIVVSPDARALSQRDYGVVDAFLLRFKASGMKNIAVLIPNGSRNEPAAKRLAVQVTGIMKSRGIAEHRIVIQHYQAAGYGDAAMLRLAYSDLTAKVAGPCGQWDENIGENSSNRNYANFGCATQQNLAAIVANPADLLGPRGETEIDSTRRTKVITDWQKDGSGYLPPLFGD